MAKLIYGAICSLDGYVADANGNFDWAAPDEEVHRFVNDLERSNGMYLYGRRMYEVMRYWATPEALQDQPDVIRDYAGIWRAADKVVYSRTLPSVSTERTRLERSFDPDAVKRWKADANADISVSGPHLAAAALKAGLVDECHLFITPVIIGGGNRALPDALRAKLALLEERRFNGGVVYLRYRITLDA